MSSMTLAQQIITIGMCILGTMATRYLPFFIFKEKCRSTARNSWNSGRNLHSCHRSTSYMEEKYVSIHCRWNYLLYVDIIFSIIISIAKRSETTCAYTLAVAVLTSCDTRLISFFNQIRPTSCILFFVLCFDILHTRTS